MTFPDADSKVSVERVHLGDRAGTQVWSALRERNVYALPCRAFHWADLGEGENMIRIALARTTEPLERSMSALRAVLERV